MTKTYNLIAFVLIYLTSCVPESELLYEALVKAKDNRPELEKVLEYYREEPLKFKAAKFLIENMPGHYSYTGELQERYHNEIDSALSVMHSRGEYDSHLVKQTVDSIENLYAVREFEALPDIQIVSCDFLIKNIDQAFNLWEKSSWAQHVSFDDFCEYLLPYSVDNFYTLENWRAPLHAEIEMEILEELNTYAYSSEMKNSVFWACMAINGSLSKQLDPDNSPNESPDIYQISTRARIPYGECTAYSRIATAIMRSVGIPVMMDFTPQWPNRSMGHTWNVLLANSGKNMPFGGCDTNPDVVHKPDAKMAKVYRKTYAINEEILKLQRTEKDFPSLFYNIFVKDVTDEYMRTVDIAIPDKKKVDRQYAYLAVFNNEDWIPVCYGKRKGNSFVFEKIGKDIVYLPIYWTKDGLHPLSDPFLLDQKGQVNSLTADTNQLEDVTLYRKYPIVQRIHKYMKRIVGGELHAANNADFSDAAPVYRIAKWTMFKDSVRLDHSKSYRYWRYVSPSGSHGNMAELEFYGADNKPLKGRIIGTEGVYDPADTTTSKYAVFDGDPLTFFDAPSEVDRPWFGMDFGKPVSLDRIVYTPRNDDNNVCEGDLYELFYWQGRWISLGQKTAESNSLTYQNVPTNALLLLYNLNRGKEVRIFTYNNSKQVWW